MGKLGEEEDKEEEPATERRKKYSDLRLDLGERKQPSRLPCFSLGLSDDRRCTSGSENASLAIFITSVSGGKSLASFTNRFFHFSRLSGFRMVFDAAKRNGKFDHI